MQPLRARCLGQARFRFHSLMQRDRENIPSRAAPAREGGYHRAPRLTAMAIVQAAAHLGGRRRCPPQSNARVVAHTCVRGGKDENWGKEGLPFTGDAVVVVLPTSSRMRMSSPISLRSPSESEVQANIPSVPWRRDTFRFERDPEAVEMCLFIASTALRASAALKLRARATHATCLSAQKVGAGVW